MQPKLRVIAVGRRRDPALEPVIEDYVARTRHLLPVSFVRVRDMDALWERATNPVVLLDERGDQLTTRQLADWLSGQREQGTREIDFLIGDADGFDDRARKKASKVLALSRLTLPHRLAQVVLVEQLYRAGTVMTGHPYHRE